MTDKKLIKALCAAAECEFQEAALSEKGLNWKPSESFLRSMESTDFLSRNRINVKKVFLIAAIIVLLGVTVLLSSANVRDGIIKFFETKGENYIFFEYGSEKAGDIQKADIIEDIFILNLEKLGFTKTEYDKTNHSIRTVWERGEDFIILCQGDGTGNHSVDTENLKSDTVTKQGVTFKYFYKDDYFLLMWNTDKYTYSLDCGGDISYEEITDIILSSFEV